MRLVGVLAAVAVLGVLVAVWLFYGTGSSGGNSSVATPPATRVGEVRQAAESVECRNNLSQIRAAIQMRTTMEEAYPRSLQELGLPATMLVCPVSGQAYQYDPNTGQVRCPTPGHASY